MSKSCSVETVEKKDAKAEPKFFSIGDIVNEFNDNPTLLVDYIKMGLRKDVSVLGVHLAQLAGMIGVPLLFDGNTYGEFPDGSWVEPKRFKNISAVLLKAETVFPSHQ